PFSISSLLRPTDRCTAKRIGDLTPSAAPVSLTSAASPHGLKRPRMDGVSSAHLKAIIQHLLAHAVNTLGCRHKPLPDDMNRRLIGDKQRPGEKVCFGLNARVASALTVVQEGRRALMAEKAMRQLMGDIAALAVGVMRVIVNDSR